MRSNVDDLTAYLQAHITESTMIEAGVLNSTTIDLISILIFVQ